jgi:opacity protein-like surface antigen
MRRRTPDNWSIHMKTAISSILSTAAALAALTCAHADDMRDVTGPYAGMALGASSFSADGAANVDDDDFGSTFRVYGGYQFTDLLGVEAGYARIGDLTQTFQNTNHTLKARSTYVAATARQPLTGTISVNGKLGLSFGEVSGNDLPADAPQATGRKRSVMAGIGAEYQPWDRIALSISYDYHGKLSDDVSASSLSAGVRFTF